MSARMIPLILVVLTGCIAVLAHLYWKSPGYLARVARRRAEDALAIEAKRWHEERARANFDRLMARDEADPESRKPDLWGVA